MYEERKRWLFLGLPFTFTKYYINEDLLTVREGFFKTVENDCYMYKIQDVTLTKSLMERLFGLSTIICYAGDTTDPTLELKHIRNGEKIRDYLVKTSDEERIRRRTVNTLNINADDLSDFMDE